MSNENHNLRKVFLPTVVVLAFGCVLVVRADAPHGWFLPASSLLSLKLAWTLGRHIWVIRAST